MEHTPGPWLLDIDNYHAGHIASVSTSDGPGPCFEVWSMNWPKSDQCEANAKLIAAAPELLNAVRFLLSNPDNRISDADVAAANAAIDKATK